MWFRFPVLLLKFSCIFCKKSIYILQYVETINDHNKDRYGFVIIAFLGHVADADRFSKYYVTNSYKHITYITVYLSFVRYITVSNLRQLEF